MSAMPEQTSFVQRALDAVRRELVVIAPLVLAFLATVPGDTAVTDYKVWGPLLIGFLLRQFVTTPAKEADEAVDASFNEGALYGKLIATTDPRFLNAVRDLDQLEHPDDQDGAGDPAP